MRQIFPIVLLVVIAACAPLRWERSDTSAQAASDDADRCLVQARERLARMTGPAGAPALDRRFGSDAMQPSPPDRRIQEEQLADRCMRDKGYRLVPAT